ncbi:hypothetical protein CC1G_04325 [Coprinopsis cinerea okayama7|uniref:Non-specific serine/threonine protein kinase n=1 Tax=Coprinopsis cinerea (strain Okayama-7 / 130 / ATCC MYA-4618 / FGSC 9003) TaxID=240176 RepID=A8N0M2_COPC7|nr:hypothetical protein CC1G_04325 [Coprinopsis cinerea okayama7\|eukprot:XP_001828354.1 hypothetical protein CC1G_04325 [Coprinopsis cinerea okayama7\
MTNTNTPVANAPAASGKQGGPSTSTSPGVLRTGTLYVRERNAFGGRVWKSKGVVLNEAALVIHQPSSNRQTRILLSSITELERTDLMPHSLSIKCGTKTYHLAFDSDVDLYDWRDDMYSRCPLGAQTTNPFNFKHTAHIGSSGATGTFTEPSTLPLYEEMMGRSIPVTAPPPPAASRSRSTPTSRRRSNPLDGTYVLTNNNNVNIEGVFFIKQTGMFAGWYWKERWLSLKGNALTVHTRKTKASPPAKEIPLSTIKSVDPDPKRSNCLIVTTTTRETCINILFNTDNELYAFREAIYLRSGLSAVISTPTNLVHAMHVTFDEATGEFKGLPDQWKTLLYPAHSAHIVNLPIQPTNTTGNKDGSGRSSRRRSQPRAADLIAPSTSKTAASPSSTPVTRVPAPSTSADTEEGSPLGVASTPHSQFLAGTSADTEGTLVSVSPQAPPLMSVVQTSVQGSGK